MDAIPPSADHPDAPAARPWAVTIATTEHFTLQSARAATISESTGRATMFLSTVSGGLVALGLVSTVTRLDTGFYAFALILLPTLVFIGLVTFGRALQSGVEDLGYARRIARLRGYYFDTAPELTPYLLSVAPEERLRVQGLGGGQMQAFRTVAGMIAVITAVLAGSGAGVAAELASGRSLAAALVAGAVVGTALLVVLVRNERSTWQRAGTAQLFVDTGGQP